MPALLLAAVAVITEVLQAERVVMDSAPAGEQEQKARFDQCQALKNVIDCHAFMPTLLGAGSFGVTWLAEAQGQSKRKVALKLLYKEGRQGERRLLYRKDLKKQSDVKRIEEAKLECGASAMLAKGSDNPWYAGSVKGPERIMQCFGHNLDIKDNSQPLYMLLENSGANDLTKFQKAQVSSNAWSLELVRQLSKQLLEGIDYMQSFRHPWIHHDLKPENVVVKTNEENRLGRPTFYTLKLIDLGTSIQHVPEERTWCKHREASPAYAPPEWKFRYTKPGSGRIHHDITNPKAQLGCSQVYYDFAHPKAFDAFAFGTILLELALGLDLDHVVGLTPLNDPKQKRAKVLLANDAYNWNLHRATFNRENAAKVILGWVVKAGDDVQPWARQFCRAVLKNPAALSFFERAFETLRMEPKDRPIPSQLLQERWMQEIVSNDDPDYVQATQDVPMEEGEGPESGPAAAGQRAPPPAGAPRKAVAAKRKRPAGGEEEEEEEEASAEPAARALRPRRKAARRL